MPPERGSRPPPPPDRPSEALIRIPSVPRTMARIEVVRGPDLRAWESTDGITRKRAFESKDFIIAQTRVPPGIISGWHHHAGRNLYGFLVEGRLHLEYGPRGKAVAEVGAGDFFHIPPGLIHRDVNPSSKQDAVVVNVLVGEGETVVNVGDPET